MKPSNHNWNTRGCTMLLAALPLALLFLVAAWWLARVIMGGIR